MSAFWQLGEFGTSTESRVRMSTTQERYPDMEAPHGEGSPVDNPEITAVELAAAPAFEVHHPFIGSWREQRQHRSQPTVEAAE